MALRYKLTLLFSLLLLGTWSSGSFASEPQNIKQNEARALYAEGLQEHRMNHIHASISKFEQALALWPEFSSAKINLDSASNELKKRIDEGYSRGLNDFQSLHYERAIKEWHMILTLIGDPNDEQYKKIEQEINLAKLRLEH